ncbi:hypothetical protein DPMN_119330 [Dreissena polymorpha]|uniref:Uncharacterized protein n=1 Tax=Dreissena polymorpha TaxID=45954 RepID=A0A9D4JMQ2_DREPO|nr:hypothetical protein DPMN_119330 [Dreissena polymorpha]
MVKDLPKIPQLTEKNLTGNVYQVKVRMGALENRMHKILCRHQTSSVEPSEATLKTFIAQQNWPLIRRGDAAGKGKGFFSGCNIDKGTVLCDNHGVLRTAEEGEELMKSVEPRQTNYMFFFRVPSGRKWCIDGAHVCGCQALYEFLATPGRCLNHSRKKLQFEALRFYDGRQAGVTAEGGL